MFQKDVYIRQKELKTSKNKRKYLKLELCFNNDRCFAYLWNNPETFYKKIHFSQAATIKGVFFEQDGRRSVNITEIILIEKVSKSVDSIIDTKVLDWYREIIKPFKGSYSSLAKKLLNKENLIDLSYYPAGKLIAFNNKGGLFLKTRDLSHLILSFDQFNFNKELTLLAVFAQTYGYINGIYHQHVFEYNDDARFLGLGTLALISCNTLVNESNLDKNEKSHLRHLITLIYKPGTKQKGLSAEAEILLQSQKLLYNYKGIERIKAKTENQFRKWSGYNQSFDRFIFLDNKN